MNLPRKWSLVPLSKSRTSTSFTIGKIYVQEDGRYWSFDGVRRRHDDDFIPIFEDELDNISATSLRQVYRKLDHMVGSFEDLQVRVGDIAFDRGYYTPAGIDFTSDGEDLFVTFDCTFDVGPTADLRISIPELIAPLLKRRRLWIAQIEISYEEEPLFRVATIKLGFNPRSRTLADLYDAANDAKALIEASVGSLSRETVAGLVRGGHVRALLGQPEGDWLEAKRQHYDLQTDYGKIRLAQSVAQFTNVGDGGVVVIGLATAKRGGIDVIEKITPMQRIPNVRRRYVQALTNRIYPPIEGLTVEVISHEGGELVVIDVPPQAEEHKPFLVHGAIVDGQVQGTFFSIVQRRYDEMGPTHPASVHAALTVGRAFLRRGELPQ